ncbi:MAG TPA: ethanolamine ammonia-lyase reactivating factor EutA [Stellaceae bacterium]|nr:ethanolamine ammonia-lyase reactivating factor EutA [Stellaceae bacterium]
MAEEGRIFFSNTGRTLTLEDEIRLTSVGVDIGSSTSHLVFSRIVLERLDARYVVAEREAFHYSDILLTPYAEADAIDAAALGAFIDAQYRAAGLAPDAIDTGALILTGVAVQRRNARAIGELFARQAGKLVAVSAGDGLETTMAAYGSGAVARTLAERNRILNVDVGGGTSKLALCERGQITALTALDVGARLIVFDQGGIITRLEPAGRRLAAELGISLAPGDRLRADVGHALAGLMADRLFEAIAGRVPQAGGGSLLRLDPLPPNRSIDEISFSGGVAEYIYDGLAEGFGDLGALLAGEIRARVARQGMTLIAPGARIRATVIGAAHYTIQVSGGTIYVAPLDALPLRNLPVVAPDLLLGEEAIDADAVASAVRAVLKRLDLDRGEGAVAVFAPWRGSATYDRLDAFCRGIVAGLAPVLAAGHPLVLAGDGDVGGLIGIHLRAEMGLENAIVSIDGLELKEFDYVDIGAILDTSGAVPVVIKSLIFPASATP